MHDGQEERAFTAWAPARTKAGAAGKAAPRPARVRRGARVARQRSPILPDGEARRSGHFGEGGLEMVGGGDLGFGERGGHQGVMGQEIDLAGQTGGGLVERLLGGGVEEGDGGAGQLETMGQVGREFLAGERRDVVADDDPLREGFVDGHGEAAAELGLAEQEQAEPVLRIHLVVGEEAEVLEDVGAEVMRLVDDQDRANAGVGAEAGDLGADLSIERGAGAFDGEAHLPGDVL